MIPIGKALFLTGLVMTAAGAVVWWIGARGGSGPSLLPGDLVFRRGNVSVHFPIVTCLVLSVLATLLLRLFNR